MNQSPILVATDFTEAARNALHHACMIAAKSGDEISLLHIKAGNTKKLLEQQGSSLEQLEGFMDQICQEARSQYGVKVIPQVKEGSILSNITQAAAAQSYRLMVMGTHGTKGLRQNLFGADVLKIVKRVALPVLVIPEENKPRDGYQTVVFPYGGHEAFGNKINATAMIAKLFDAEVHVYAIERPKENISKVTIQNVESAKEVFDGQGIRYKEVREPSELYAPGFAQQTVAYAAKVGADLIAVMGVPSVEYAYISTIDKDFLVNNEQGIAILITADY